MMEGLTVEQAVETLLGYTGIITDTEEVELCRASGRILAREMAAEFDNPPFDRSPVDGYACRAADTKGASPEHPVRLRVVGELDAGQYSRREVKPGEAVRIMTGAAIPPGCDCCIYQEVTDCGEKTVAVYQEMERWQNYCFRGEDFRRGAVLLFPGVRLGFLEAGVLAGMGVSRVPVFRRARVALLTTGDEVTEPGRPLAPGKIYDSNQTLLAVRLRELGAELVQVSAADDQAERVADALREMTARADLVITTGGVSVGKRDILHEALNRMGAERIFWRIKMKPGMPTLFSVYQNTPILSMSGNPFGVVVAAEVLVRPMLQKMTRDDRLGLVRRRGVMEDAFPKQTRGRRFIRAIWEEGRIRLPKGLHSNGILSSAVGCNCLIDVKPDSPALLPGTEAEVIML